MLATIVTKQIEYVISFHFLISVNTAVIEIESYSNVIVPQLYITISEWNIR